MLTASVAYLILNRTQPIFHLVPVPFSFSNATWDTFFALEEVPDLPSGTGTIAGRFE
jgi:hypothetical protein